MTDSSAPPPEVVDDPMPLRSGTCSTCGREFNNFSGKCLASSCAHEPGYETDGDGWTVVRCACGDFYRICESEDVAEAEYRNHVDLADGDA